MVEISRINGTKIYVLNFVVFLFATSPNFLLHLKFTFLPYLVKTYLFCVGLSGNIRALWAEFMEISYGVFFALNGHFLSVLYFPIFYIVSCNCISLEGKVFSTNRMDWHTAGAPSGGPVVLQSVMS